MSTKLSPKITMACQEKNHADRSLEEIRDLLYKILPKIDWTDRFGEKQARLLKKTLPIVHWEYLSQQKLAVTFLCKQRTGVVHFFYDMMSRWLLPHERLNSSFFFSSDFSLPNLRPSLLTIAQIVLEIDESKKQSIEQTRSKIHSELRLGARSSSQAHQILTFKDLSPDKKAEMIQKKIGALVHKPSGRYEKSILTQMQRFFVTAKEEFKKVRSHDHIAQVIALLYWARKRLQKNLSNQAHTERQVVVKFMKAKLTQQKRVSPVLGIVVGMNFLQEREVFEEKHFRAALEKIDPKFSIVEGSFFVDQNQNSSHNVLYLELKKRGGEISSKDIQVFRSELPQLIKSQIACLTHPIFKPRNEEEVLKSIMALAQQLKYVDDLPQMIINFDGQENDDLVFTVIFLRILKTGYQKLLDLFQNVPKHWGFRLERRKNVGTLRRKYPKEAAVFSVKIPSKTYLQEGHYVDLYQARAHLFHKITELVGEVRDYNGGMMHAQAALLDEVKTSLGPSYQPQYFFLEKLFFSMQPSEMRYLLSCFLLKAIFRSILQCLKKGEKSPSWTIKEHEGKALFVSLQTDREYRDKVHNLIQKEDYPSCELITYSIEECFGFILLSRDPKKRSHLARLLRNG
ncbi:MAG: hypothetical protein AAGI90_04550 [Chlamydiota bacterium]